MEMPSCFLIICLLACHYFNYSNAFFAPIKAATSTRIALSTRKGFLCSSYMRKGATELKASTTEEIVSPFDEGGKAVKEQSKIGDELTLTLENVELVLDEMRPFLKADGGNVRVVELDGPIVKLELLGSCGSCPSSAMTMKMGLERKLKERIPEITEVVQTVPDAPAITRENLEEVLDGVRPFLAVAGGKITVNNVAGVGGLQPSVSLCMEGSSAALQSVKVEIMQRIQRKFLTAVRVDWV